jgi:hypothetical protein
LGSGIAAPDTFLVGFPSGDERCKRLPVSAYRTLARLWFLRKGFVRFNRVGLVNPTRSRPSVGSKTESAVNQEDPVFRLANFQVNLSPTPLKNV